MAAPFNAEAWLVDRHVASGRGAHVAVRSSDGHELTYAALAEHVAATAAGLRGLRLHHDDRVVFVTGDDVAMFSGILACFRAGLVAVPVSTMLSGHELGAIVDDSGARVVVVGGPFGPQVEEALQHAPDVHTVVTVGDLEIAVPPAVTALPFSALVASGRAAPAELREVTATTDDSWALWLYTSGTTGQPKGAMHRHANIRFVCETYGLQVLGITANDVCLSVAKLFFAYGIGNSMFFPLAVGATAVLEAARPTPASIAARVRAERPSLFFAVPTFYAGMLASDVPDDTFTSVRLAASAGEPLPAALL
ncbi:MAG: AMP-binding protein, partial [Lapillicoccus sp.]